MLTVLNTPNEAAEFLGAAGTKGPTLHPRANNPVDTYGNSRFNGWNHTTATGIDANNVPIFIQSTHYASGRIDYSADIAGGGFSAPGLSGPFTYPITVLPAYSHILYPEHTPN